MADSDTAVICPACKAENKVGARFCRQCGAQIAASTQAYDRAKWQALVQYDPDISVAADTVRPFGQMWVDELGASYMALNDKSYLPGIVEKVTARAKAEKQRQAEIRHQQAELQAAAAERARQDEHERQRIAEQRREQLRALKATLWGSRNRQIATTCISVAVIVALGFFHYWQQPSRVDAHEVFATGEAVRASGAGSPTTFATELYRSYLNNMATQFNVTPRERATRDTAWRKHWLTPRFARQFSSIGNKLDSDPVILAQDYCEGWLRDIDASLISSNGSYATVAVKLGAHTNSWHGLRATLALVHGHWRLDSAKPDGVGPSTNCAN